MTRQLLPLLLLILLPQATRSQDLGELQFEELPSTGLIVDDPETAFRGRRGQSPLPAAGRFFGPSCIPLAGLIEFCLFH